MNNLDPDVAENPDKSDRLWRDRTRGAQLGGVRCDRAFASRTGERRDAAGSIRETGRRFPHAREAPRVLIANSNLVGQWSNYAEFNRLERLGLTMYGQMTAGSWIYIGSQGIVQGTFETFAPRPCGISAARSKESSSFPAAWAEWVARNRSPRP